MSAKIVELREIKTNGPRRTRKQVKEDLKHCVGLVDMYDIRGYALVMFDKEGGAVTCWDTRCLGAGVSAIRGDLAKRALDRQQSKIDAQQFIFGDEDES